MPFFVSPLGDSRPACFLRFGGARGRQPRPVFRAAGRAGCLRRARAVRASTHTAARPDSGASE
jgi:hypothetical protein